MKQPKLTRTAISVTIHPSVLAMIDQRSENGNRSEQINADLARFYLITGGKEELTPTEARRLKSLALMADLSDHETVCKAAGVKKV